ncbi:MAG: hypothetical protein JWM56_293 [Candidatus Peribacteria bacterium]|nr:hypothetical protein [Candidatus Peribacteria bacterium]
MTESIRHPFHMNPQELIGGLTAGTQQSTRTRAIFGDPVKKGDTTIIPVDKVTVRGGGMSDQSRGKRPAMTAMH